MKNWQCCTIMTSRQVWSAFTLCRAGLGRRREWWQPIFQFVWWWEEEEWRYINKDGNWGGEGGTEAEEECVLAVLIHVRIFAVRDDQRRRWGMTRNMWSFSFMDTSLVRHLCTPMVGVGCECGMNWWQTTDRNRSISQDDKLLEKRNVILNELLNERNIDGPTYLCAEQEWSLIHIIIFGFKCFSSFWGHPQQHLFCISLVTWILRRSLKTNHADM